jgi:hypothetical protein
VSGFPTGNERVTIHWGAGVSDTPQVVVAEKLLHDFGWGTGLVSRVVAAGYSHHITRDRQSAAADLPQLDFEEFVGHREEMLGREPAKIKSRG